MEFKEFRQDFLKRLREDSSINGSETEDEFINVTMDLFEKELPDQLERTNMGDKRGRGGRVMRIDGYGIDEADRSLVLFICDFQDSYDPVNLTSKKVDEFYWRMYYFLDEACNGNLNDYFDDSDDILKIGKFIRKRINANNDDPEQILKIRLVILTNKELDSRLIGINVLETTIRKGKGKNKKTVIRKTNKRIKKADFNNKPLEVELIPIDRYYEKESENSDEPIIIDVQDEYFSRLGYKGIPCIKGNVGDNLGYDAYIAIIPGDLLANIYITYGSKVLEGNVRAFLGTSGSKTVNQGIKRTIHKEPTKFFTYNNGIATTAADVEVVENNGESLITKIIDFQIINGGQTTATLAEAVLKKTNVNLEGIYVPMKLTVIEDRETENEEGIRFYDEMVKAIAKYANSQNKVTAADLFSNDPFHIWMEKMSKKYLAKPVKFSTPTGWFYERARKKYKQEQVKLKSSELSKFILKFPKNQVITKEQLAMYLTTIECKPDIVSKGKNWVIKEFNTQIGDLYREKKEVFNEFYFKHCICAAILFRTVDQYLEKNKDSDRNPTGFWYKVGGYKLNIVPYTIAKILSCIPNGYTLNWEKIWNEQSLSPAFMREIEKVTKITNDFICDSHGVIVTEYCKRNSTWVTFRDNVQYELDDSFIKELVTKEYIAEKEKEAKTEQKTTNEYEALLQEINRGEEYWARLLTEGTNRKLLKNNEITELTQFLRMIRTGSIPMGVKGKLPKRTLTTLQTIQEVKEKLEAEGL